MMGVSKAGGGGAIYKDGTPVNETLREGESITVPTGETWVLSIGSGNGANNRVTVEIDNTGVHGDSSGYAYTNRVVVTEGQTISSSGDSGSESVLSGWSV